MLRATLLLALFLQLGCGDDAAPADLGPVPTDLGPVSDAGSEDAGPTAPRPDGSAEVVDPVAGAGAVEAVASSFMGQSFGFLAGPHWRGDHLVFSDLIFATPARQSIYALGDEDAVSVVVRPSQGANGIATAPDGSMVTCLQFGRAVARVEGDTLVTLFDRYEGQRLNAPNDLVFRSDGLWYFSDPGYGVEAANREIDAHGVYLVDGDSLQRVWTGTTAQRPNGVALSPDEATLYVADTADGVVRAFAVAADGTLDGERTFASVSGPDGMSVDAAGNVYVASASGVAVFGPDGASWGTLSVPTQPTNCAFGDADGRTLYITAGAVLYRARLPIAGL